MTLRPLKFALAASLAVVPCLASPLAQVADWSIDGSSYASNLGWSLDAIPDADGDGASDLLVAEPRAVGVQGRIGEVRVVSGRTGETILKFGGVDRHRPLPLSANDRFRRERFGVIVRSIGDLDADGVADYAANAPIDSFSSSLTSVSCVHLYSGATGSPLYFVRGVDPFGTFGISLDALGDTNGDGHDDFIVGDDRFTGTIGARQGAAYVLSGSDGTVILELVGGAPSARFGRTVAGIGDVNADGVPDFAVLIPLPGGVLSGLPSVVRVFSGLNGSTLYEIDSSLLGSFATPSPDFGHRIVKAGDLNFDGINDFVISDTSAQSAGGYSGATFLCSGRDGQLIRTHVGETSFSQFGYDVQADTDLNGDGVLDLVVGDPFHFEAGVTRGRIYAYSGQDGSLLTEILPSTQIFGGFSWALAVGDFNGDGVPDVAGSQPLLNSPLLQSGRVSMFFR